MAGSREIWTDQHIRDLMSLVHSEPILWMITHEAYYDSESRNAALLRIATRLGPEFTSDMVKIKWETTRGQYRREVNRLLATMAKKPDDGTDQVVKSKWRFFKYMSFLRGAIAPRSSLPNLKSQHALDAQADDDRTITPSTSGRNNPVAERRNSAPMGDTPESPPMEMDIKPTALDLTFDSEPVTKSRKTVDAPAEYTNINGPASTSRTNLTLDTAPSTRPRAVFRTDLGSAFKARRRKRKRDDTAEDHMSMAVDVLKEMRDRIRKPAAATDPVSLFCQSLAEKMKEVTDYGILIELQYNVQKLVLEAIRLQSAK